MPGVSPRSHYADDIRLLLGAEQPLRATLSRMAETVKGPFLRGVLHEHGYLADKHLRRLQEICDELQVATPADPSARMRSLVVEVNAILAGDLTGARREYALAVTAQAISQYKVVRYAATRLQALRLGYHKDAALLEQSLNEEMTIRDALDTTVDAVPAADRVRRFPEPRLDSRPESH